MKKIKINTEVKVKEVASHAVDTLPGKVISEHYVSMLNGLWDNMPFQIRKARKYTYVVISGGDDGFAVAWAYAVDEKSIEGLTAKDLEHAQFGHDSEWLLIPECDEDYIEL